MVTGPLTKPLVYALLLIITAHVLVLDAVHHEHDQGWQSTQAELVQVDVLDQGADHCCQCHGFVASLEAAPPRTPLPDSLSANPRPGIQNAHREMPFRPPIA